MTELDSTQTDGTQGSQPAGSSASGSGGSFDPSELKAVIDSLSSTVKEIDARTRSLQGDKDRGISKLTKEIEDAKNRLAAVERLKKLGLTEDEAVLELASRQASSNQPVTPAPVGNETVKVDEIIGEYGLDMTNPEVKIAFEGRQFKSREEAELTAARLLKPKPKPTNAQMPAQPASPTSVTGDADSLIVKYNELAKKPSVNFQEMQGIKKRLQEMKVW